MNEVELLLCLLCLARLLVLRIDRHITAAAAASQYSSAFALSSLALCMEA